MSVVVAEPDEAMEPLIPPFDRWREQSRIPVELLAAHAEKTTDTPANVIEAMIENGAREHGLRPARVLLNHGLLTREALNDLIPASQAERDAQDDGRSQGADDWLDSRASDEAARTEPAETNQQTPSANGWDISDIAQSRGEPLTITDVDSEVARYVEPETLHRLMMLPFRRDADGRIVIAISVPPAGVPWQDRDEICDLLSVSLKEVVFRHTDKNQLLSCIELTNSAQITEQLGTSSSGAEKASASENYDALVRTAASDEGNRAGQAIRQLILQAVQRDASDIHIVGERDQNGLQCYRARLRIDGDLQLFTDNDGKVVEWDTKTGDAMTHRIAAVGELADDALSFRDGRYDIQPTNMGIFDLRVSVAPTVDGHFTALRLLGTQGDMDMEDIYPTSETDLVPQFKEIFADMRKGGLFLVAGATGSGKSTFLAAAARHLSTSDVNFVTIEHPVENRIAGARQIQVDPDSETLSFHKAIIAAMRLDPDIILIGELRDHQTVNVAIQAAKTGHMVLSTIHVSDAAGTPSRFRDLGVEPIEVARVLSGVLAQSLVRTRCANCAQKGLPPDDCAQCNGTGKRGRAAVGELLKMDRNIVEMIRRDADPEEIAEAAEIKSKAVNAGALIASGRVAKEDIANELGVTAAEEAQAEYLRLVGSKP